jgi:DNA-binding CsgD family transcriptional regulator
MATNDPASTRQVQRRERNVEILRRWNEGQCLEEIALYFGLSRERIRQVLQGLIGKDWGNSQRNRKLTANEVERATWRRVQELLTNDTDLSMADISKVLGLSTPQAREMERNLRVIECWEKGQNLNEISDSLGLSREIVRRTVKKFGGPNAKDLRKRRRPDGAAVKHASWQAVTALIDLQPGLSSSEISRNLGSTSPQVLLTEREIEIVRRRFEGQTLEEIAQHFGVSRERIRQIVKKVGGPSAVDLKNRRWVDREARQRINRQRIVELLESAPGLSMFEVSRRLKLEASEIRRLAPSHVRRLVVDLDVQKTGALRWSNEEVLGAIRDAATYEFPLSASTYGELVARREVVGPSVPLVYLRFGSWTSACSAAKVESGVSLVESYESRWTDDDLLGFVAAYLLRSDSQGTFRGYDEWAKQAEYDAPSAGTIRKRLGSWNDVKKQALRWRADATRVIEND